MRSTRSGIVLATTLYVLVLVALLVAAGFHGVTHARWSGDRLLDDAALTAAADNALMEVITRWPESFSAAGVGVTTTVTMAASTSSLLAANAQVSCTRLSPTLFWVVAEARGHPPTEGLRRVGIVARIHVIDSVTTVPRIVSGRGWGDLF